MQARSLIVLVVATLAILLALAQLPSCQRQMLYYPSREIAAPTLDGVEAVRIDTEDGERLVAWWRPPPDEAAPVFLYFDGNAGRPELGTDRWTEIARGGAGFLAVYYRGYSGSTGRPSERGLHTDARAGYDWLIEHGVAPERIVIHGYSLGAAVAVRLAAERPARALVIEAPFTGVDDIAARLYTPLARLFVRDRFASRDWIGRVRAPVLILHGDADAEIPLSHSERLFALANEPKRLVRMQGSDHATLVRDGAYDHVWNFLAQHPGE